jgi:hypothetical protein
MVVVGTLVLAYIGFNINWVSSKEDAEPSGSLTLSWIAPTENEDASPITDLAGYVIRYGTRDDQLTNSVVVRDPKATIYRFENLKPGTYYFAIAAVNVHGFESALSNIVTKTVPSER